MATSKELKEMVLTKLKTLSVCTPNSIGTQWTIRCPYCGDSSDMSHGHLSVRIDLDNEDAPMVWRCLKCDESGLVSATFLKDVGTYVTPDETRAIKLFNKKSSKFNKFLNDYEERFEVPIFTRTPLNDQKLRYINDRLGTDFQYEDCPSYKIVLDLYEFMNFNHITSIDGMKPGYIWFMNQNYVGFMTASNAQLICRSISPDKNVRRYNKIRLNPRNLNPNSFYIIPAQIDLLSPRPLNVHIAEGTFDILSVARNVAKPTLDEDNIFLAACGFGATTIIQYLVYAGLGSNLRVHLYCDNDKSDAEEIRMLKKRSEMLAWVDELYFHRNRFIADSIKNKYEKDFGVPVDRIIDSAIKINL